ncbi:MaoC/PaaZ C-terminal domain-containing protein [Mangrovicoccus sp. HB161399]|uniref:MaoC/PaaZ C-terminal domain-containing protein n=1 Tax=Mangrovicoccus sp. HB161399 TaxID=2720392 RepID=UPI0015568713|nr:MaoC/PaaZ C-terminal domain-containing protein [Mangrovicoccus sp. HB161399]
MTKIETGASVTFRKTMTVAEQGFYTGISGDMDPLHVDRVKAQAAGLADMAVFELAAGSLFSTAMARLSGPGWRIESVSLRFVRPLSVGETLAATATVASTNGVITFDLAGTCGGEKVIEGEARLGRVAADV